MVRACNLCGSRETRLQYEIDGFHIVRCMQCHLVYVAEEIGGDELAAHYGEAYYTGAQKKGYSDYIGRRKVRKDYFRSTIPMIRRYLAVETPRVLDVGCAAGFFLEVAREQGWQARGVELSAYAAEYARSQFGLDVVTGTLAAAKFPLRSFDLITLWDVIEHLPNPSEILTLVHDLLRPSGLVIISTGDISGATARLYGRRWALLAPPGHLFYFSRRTLFAMLRQTAFEPLTWHSDGAFLLNDSGRTGEQASGRQLPSLAIKLHYNRWVNRLLRRLKLGSIITVYARKCVTS